jgi:DNA polymerase III delta prime subunit
MHAYLITGTDNDVVDAKVAEIAKTTGSRVVEYELAKIQDVRDLEKFVKLSTAEPITILVKEVDQASIPALNAFLKSLEEPHEGISFILTAGNIHNVLPTVVSRCQVVKLKSVTQIDKSEERSVNNFLTAKPLEKLAFIEKIRHRDEAASFLQSFIAVCHKELIKNHEANTAKYINAAQKSLSAVQQNANVNLQLTAFVIRLSKINSIK